MLPQQDLPFKEKDLFTKKSYKTYDSQGLPTRHSLTAATCPLCFGYGFRNGALVYRKDPRVPSEDPPTKYVNSSQFQKGEEEGRKQNLPMYPPEGSGVNPAHIVFPIVRGENGEQYHAIICSFLSEFTPSCITICAPEKKGGPTQAQVDLLYYYIPSESIKRDGEKNATSKEEATKYIANVFKTRSDPAAQAEFYESIRCFLNDETPVARLTPHRYMSPSYTAKYWINRFLVLTKQKKLPKPIKGEVKVAIIMLRTEPKANDPRRMTDEHLKACINAIRAANQVAVDNGGGKPISHVLLYGDKSTVQMRTFIKNTEEVWKKERKVGPKLLYLTSPFKTDNQEEPEINQFWANYRALDGSFFHNVPEAIPVETKTLAIFLALQKRYQNRICTIGFRSGTLDGAGFLGIPIFYLDNTKTENVWDDRFADMQYIWDGDSEGAKIKERMAYASQTLNTFVRVNIQDEYDGTGPDKVLKKKDEELKHLGAALYMYMFEDNEGDEGDGLLWLRRVSLMNGDEKGRLQSRCNTFVEGLEKIRFRESMRCVPYQGTRLVEVQTTGWASTHKSSWSMQNSISMEKERWVQAASHAVNTPTLDLMSFTSYCLFLLLFLLFCILLFS